MREHLEDYEGTNALHTEIGLDRQLIREDIRLNLRAWFQNLISEGVLTGYLYKGMRVWVSIKNMCYYKSVYEHAVRTNGDTLPITFMFGTDKAPEYYTFTDIAELKGFWETYKRYLKDYLKYYWRANIPVVTVVVNPEGAEPVL